MDKSRILLIRTGGTMDSEPYDDPKNPPKFVDTLQDGNSIVIATIAALPNHENVDSFTWGKWEERRFVKDSQFFTQEDLHALAGIIKDDEHRYFILTHGTDAMVKNATALRKELQSIDKIVVFAGAMVPLSMHQKHGSDGVDTLRFTLQNITRQAPGLHIVGRDAGTKRLSFFNPENVQKDRAASLESSSLTLAPNGRGNWG